MTQTTAPAGKGRNVSVTESFSKYRFDSRAASARTDAPDLMCVFRDAAALAEGYVVMRSEMEAAHADLAEASFKTLPDW